MLAHTFSRPLSSPRGTGGNRFRVGACRVALLAAGCSLALGAGDAFAGQLPVPLGAASSYAALAGSTVTSTGFTTLNGDLGVWPGTSLTGFPPGMVSGTAHAGDAFAMSAQGDLTAAYNDAAGRQPPQALPADVGGETLAPGVYKTGATPALGVTGTLTLDGRGDPNAVFVFEVGSALTTAVDSHVNLIGGAKPGNVFWQIGSSATLGTSSTFAGTILALTSISINSGVTLNGRALARNGAVTLIDDTINAPTASPPPPPPPPPPGGDTRPPGPPVLLSPRAHATVRAGSVSFRWRAPARAERYTLMVDHHRMNTGPRTTAKMRVRAGSHSYRVIARNDYGARSSSDRAFRAAPRGLCRVCHADPPMKRPDKTKPRPKTKNPGRRTCKSPGRNPKGRYAYLVYEAKKNDRVVYVGISRSFRARCAAYRVAGSLLADLVGAAAGKHDGIFALSHLNFLSLSEARQVEQVLIEKYGFGRTHRNLNKNLDQPRRNPGIGQLRNRRNEISAANKSNYCLSVDFGRVELIGGAYFSRARNPFMRRRNCAG